MNKYKVNSLAATSSDILMSEIWRMTRRFQNHREIPERERTQYAVYLSELWEAFHLQQSQTRIAEKGDVAA